MKSLRISGGAILLGYLLAGCNGGGSGGSELQQSLPPVPPPLEGEFVNEDISASGLNVILIMTDDQRWDSIGTMPELSAMARRGVVFENSYVSTPVCGPSRASFLSGGHFARATGVRSNKRPNGAWRRLNEQFSLAQQVKASGYRTGFVGKYMSGYKGYIKSLPESVEIDPPAGWDYFYADSFNNFPVEGYYDSAFIEFSPEFSPPGYRRGSTTSYLTDMETSKALGFIESSANEPFFLFLNYWSPHIPATDDNQKPEDRLNFQDFKYEGRAFGTLDEGKSELVKPYSRTEFLRTERFAQLPRGQLRLLQPVDRGVAQIMQRLADLNLDERTVVILTSDNGHLWGEHGIVGKSQPYEESVRVPLLMFSPKLAPARVQSLVSANLDIPATVLDIMGSPSFGDGQSLLPLLNPENAKPESSEVFLEHYAAGPGEPYIWNAIIRRTDNAYLKLIEYSNGDTELYDLLDDPYERENRLLADGYQVAVQSLRSALGGFKRLTILDTSVPGAVSGQPYRYQLRWWGADSVSRFLVSKGVLPPGIDLTRDGALAGVPTSPGRYQFTVKAVSSEKSPYDNAPLKHFAELEIVVEP